MSSVKIDDAIAGYLKLRKQLDDLKEQHRAAEAVVRGKMEKLESFFLAFLQVSGGDSFAARGVGTIFKQDVVSCTVKDWQATLDWIRANEGWEFLERRVSKSVVQEYAAVNNEIPPGVEMTTKVEVRVRTS